MINIFVKEAVSVVTFQIGAYNYWESYYNDTCFEEATKMVPPLRGVHLTNS